MIRLDEGGRAARQVRILAPPPGLRRWVQHVSIQPGPARHDGWRVVPDTASAFTDRWFEAGDVLGAPATSLIARRAAQLHVSWEVSW